MTPGARTRPLARRLRIALLAIAAVCIAVAAGVFYLLWSQQTLARNLNELERQVGVVASGVAVAEELPGSSADVGGARERLLKVEAGLLGVRLSVADGGGAVLFSTAGANAPASYPVATFERGETQLDARTGVLDAAGAGRVAVVAVPVAFAEDGTPTRYLVGARALSELRAGDWWVLVAILIAGLVGLVTAWVLGGVVTRQVTGPLLRLSEGVDAVAHGEWGRQIPVEGDDEVAELAEAFNAMSARVGDAYRAQQDFVADVSHELRTPVASIRGFAEAIADGVVTEDAAVRRSATIIGAEAERLTELTTTLLALADLDSGAVVVTAEPVDVGALASSLEDRLAAVAAEGGRELSVVVAQGTPLADAARLLQALSALVENALRYTRPGGSVRVTLGAPGAHAGTWRAEVADDGPGIAEAERERVFGRFTRLDASRSDEGGGSGLGLAICRRLAELMGGRVWADEPRELTGARFVLELPEARTDST